MLTLDEARDQCRLEDDYPAEQLQPYIDAAVDAAAQYLNRALFADQKALDDAQDALPQTLGQARAAYEAATEAAEAVDGDAERAAAIELACVRLDRATHAAARTMHGIVANPSILAAVRLTLGELFAMRENAITGQVSTIPTGSRALLTPYRRRMMP